MPTNPLQIRLCNTTSPQRKIYKELTEGITKNITFRDSEDVCNPVVLLTYSSGIDGYNYAFIENLNRYYWIQKIEELIGGICALTLKVDVLMTYKPAIMGASLMLKRKSKSGLSMIPDNQMPMMPMKTMRTVEFTTKPFPNNLDSQSQCFVLQVAGK